MAWIYQRAGSANWWIGWRIGKKSYFRSTGSPDKVTAEQELAKLNMLSIARKAGSLTQDFYESLTGRELSKTTLKQALAEWLAEVKGATSPRTCEKYDAVARAFSTYARATDTTPLLADVTTDLVRGYLTAKRTKVSASTVNLEKKVLSMFFKSAIQNGKLKSSPVLPIPQFKAGRGEVARRRPFTLKELQMMHEKAPSEFWRYMISGGFYTGLRMGDLITLPIGAVDLSAGIIRLSTAKTGARIQIPIAKPLRALLRDLIGKPGQKPGDYLWPQQAEKYLVKGSGQFSNEFYDSVLLPCGLVPARTQSKKAVSGGRNVQRDSLPVSFHCLRHSFVTYLKAAGGNQAVAKALAGHSSDMVSDNYTSLPIETLTAAVNLLPEVTK